MACTLFIFFHTFAHNFEINTTNMKKSYLAPRPSSKSVRKVSFSCFSDSLFGLICHYSPNSPKNLLFALIALLFISSCKKDPVEQKVTSITLAPSSPQAAVGGNQQLEVTALPADATNKEVTLSSSDEKKVAVDATGKVTGIAKGTAVITAIAKDGSNVKGTVTVSVTVKATSIAITPAEPSVGIGGNLTLTAAALPAEADQAVRWASSDPTKATIDAATGVATGIGLGSTTITAAAADGSGITGTVTLTVRAASADASVSAITLGDENFTIAVPAEGGTTALANAPHTVASDITAVKVNVTAAAEATIKIGNTAFTQGQLVDFTNPVTFTVTAQDGTTVKNYTIHIPAYNATSNPYGIYTVKHLVDVDNGLTASYLLKNNIDLPSKDAADAATATGISDYASSGWKPLGAGTSSTNTSINIFAGTFDGGNFSINNFYANRAVRVVGLFGYIGNGAVIKNLGVNGVSGMAVTGGSSPEGSSLHSREQCTGILAGFSSEGTIDRCYATGNVSSSSSSSSTKAYAGGLVGRNGASISNSYATGSVSASSTFTGASVAYPEAYAGGLAGSNGAPINNSYATGSVSASSVIADVHAGGLVGRNGGRISNSHATGGVSATTSATRSSVVNSGACARGLVGTSEDASISNSYATGSVSSASTSTHVYAGGLVGLSNYYGTSPSISNSHATGDVVSSSVSSSASSSNFSRVYAGGLAGYSRNSISNSYATGSVSSSSSATAEACAGGLTGSNIGTISNSYATGSVSASTSDYRDHARAGGLVGYKGENGSISNSYATGNVSSTSTSSVGGLVGHNDYGGTISNSYATGSVSGGSVGGGLAGSNSGSISNSYATGSVSGGSVGGGLVGSNSGGSSSSISNSYATGNVSSTSTSSSTSVGGLVGSNSSIGSISNSYATGSVSSSATDVSAKVGGLVGRNVGGTTEYTNCYRNSNAVIKKGNVEVTPDDASTVGITPKTKTDMQTDVFKGNLNGTSGTVWGRSDAKNDKLPFIIGVGAGG